MKDPIGPWCIGQDLHGNYQEPNGLVERVIARVWPRWSLWVNRYPKAHPVISYWQEEVEKDRVLMREVANIGQVEFRERLMSVIGQRWTSDGPWIDWLPLPEIYLARKRAGDCDDHAFYSLYMAREAGADGALFCCGRGLRKWHTIAIIYRMSPVTEMFRVWVCSNWRVDEIYPEETIFNGVIRILSEQFTWTPNKFYPGIPDVLPMEFEAEARKGS